MNMVRILYGSRSGLMVAATRSSFGISAYVCTRRCPKPSARVADQRKTNVFTSTIVIVIMGNVRVGTLSFSGIIFYVVLPRSFSHVKETTGVER